MNLRFIFLMLIFVAMCAGLIVMVIYEPRAVPVLLIAGLALIITGVSIMQRIE